jgi:hypothetical protein
VVREGVGAGGRNDSSLVCTYDNKTIKKKKIKKKEKPFLEKASLRCWAKRKKPSAKEGKGK